MGPDCRRCSFVPSAGERGTTLVAVLAYVSSSLLIGAALFALGAGEADVVEYTVDSSRAFYLAEAGQERARTWLEEEARQEPPVYPACGAVTDVALGGGEYDVSMTQIPGHYSWLAEYAVVASGDVDGAVRTVRSVLRHETFAQYLYFSNSASDIWFTTGDSLWGRTHSNGHVKIDGDPWFGMKVTSAEPNIIIQNGSNPIFEDGYEVGVDPVPFPDPGDVASALSAAAISGGGTYCGTLNGNDARYEVELGREGATGYLSYRTYEKHGNYYETSDWTDVDISGTNGIFWFDENVYLSGVLDGEATVGTSGTIYIVDDVLYDASTPGHGPDPDCDDLLGLVAGGDIIVADTTPNEDNCEIHAHMLALWKSFQVEDYNQGSPRGDLTLWGGFAQEKCGPVGTFGPWGLTHGYEKDYHWDTRLSLLSPPGYPATDRYIVVNWQEISGS
jgi:hypothetical protein